MENGNIESLKELINLFEHNIKQYKGKHYDEAKTRVDFIDKFFELLGWDIRNIKEYSEQYREVVREDRVEIKGKVKAPDYSFRIGGFRKFFVEAKKPSVNIKHDIEPAFQLRRYAYTAKLPLSILTDFEEFAVYDTRIKPDKHDQASTARVFYCTYEEYEKEFDFLFNTFSRQAILKGSFDQYIEDTKGQRRTSEVDKEFLKFIEKWRENLAKNIALRNKNLTIYELNYAVQKIIDRIIFLRIAEDRDVEDYGKIQKLLENKKTIYPQLVNLFLQADVKYDSGLFNFKADQFTPKLKIDDKILKDIIKSIYYPDSPYEFSVFDVEILGNIYEQFLGKTIRLTASHQAKIENKPEVKKAGGVYYTPKYIVDYIVKNSVEEKIKNKTPDQILKLKILDPACGSGSFLLGAYQMLMNYHLEYYTKDKNIKKSLKDNKIYQIKENECQLTIEEKHRILLNNIFGVDIDSQAVEVTKLSLLLKLMEGESQESAGMLFKFSDIKMLPDLSENIKCGNSLIGSDFYESAQMNLFQDEETTRRINVFDWHKEFPDIFTQGGFDIVIGNPPYVKYENLNKEESFYYKKTYKTAIKFFDIFSLFLEKSFYLCREDGVFSFIFPNLFLKGMNYIESRKFFLENTWMSIINDYSDGVFENVQMPTCVIVFHKKIIKNYKVIFYSKNVKIRTIDQDKILKTGNKIISPGNLEFSNEKKYFKLGDIAFIRRGLEIGRDKSDVDGKIETLFGTDIERYFIKGIHTITEETYETYKKEEKIFLGEKLIIRETGSKLIIVYDKENMLLNRSLYVIKSNDVNLLYLLGILNSKLIQKYYEENYKSNTEIFPKIRIGQVRELPVRKINFENKKEIELHDNMVKMVDQMLDVQKKYHNAKTENEKTIFKKQIDILDNQIDQLVYRLYNLTEEEIKIVEGGK